MVKMDVHCPRVRAAACTLGRSPGPLMVLPACGTGPVRADYPRNYPRPVATDDEALLGAAPADDEPLTGEERAAMRAAHECRSTQ
jgi:hypothetical protein